MAKREILAGVADQTIDVFIMDSSSTIGAGLSGLAYNTSGLKCYYRKGATGSATALTLATQTVGGAHSDGGFVEIDATNMKGVYRLDLSDTIVATAGMVTIYLYGATNMAPVAIEIEVVSVNKFDSVRMGLTALPNAAAEAAGGLYTRGSGAGQINQTNNGRVDSDVQSIANSAVTANAIAADAITAAKIADGAIDAATFAAGAINAAAIATDAIDADALKTDAVTEINAGVLAVLGALADAAADGDPTNTDTIVAYLKQLINTLEGTAGMPTWPAASAPGNAVSLAGAIRSIYTQIGVAGAGLSAMPWNAAWDAEVQSEANDALVAFFGATWAAAIATLLTTQMTESYAADTVAPTLSQALFMIQQGIMEMSISGTTLTIKKIDKSTTAATVTLNDASNPTSRTRAT